MTSLWCADAVRVLYLLLTTFIRGGLKELTAEFRAMAEFAERVKTGEVSIGVDRVALRELLVNYWGLESWR